MAAQGWVRSGEVVSLDIEAGEIDPPLFGRGAPTRKRVRALGAEAAAFDEVLSGWNARQQASGTGSATWPSPEWAATTG